MEYVVVSYPNSRRVYVDKNVAGNTNDTLMVEAGHHVFDLGKLVLDVIIRKLQIGSIAQ